MLIAGLSEIEWWDVIRALKPDVTQQEFDEFWTEFVRQFSETLH